MAQAHKLINNCTGCGKIVCELEGEGPCSFCGNPVLKPENMDQFAETERLMREWEADSSLSQTYFVAVEHKTRLLGQDKERGAAKNLVDEDTDWYELKGDVWQSDDLRRQAVQMMIKQEEEDRFAKENVMTSFNFNKGTVEEKKITFDRSKEKALIAEMIQEDRKGVEIEQMMMQQEMDKRLKEKDRELLDSVKEVYKDKVKKSEPLVVKNDLNLPKKVENDDCYQAFMAAMELQNKKEKTAEKGTFDRPFYRLGPDDTKCLSMWQPWASLLVYGFKRFEGRHWDTNYRGPLWIHAGAKEPDQATIKGVEDQYRKMYEGLPMPPFPKSYPTGCIIGVVDLQDVIDQKAYTEFIPKKYTCESTSEHLFVVRNPRKLMVNIKCNGNKGIFDLNEKTVATAINTTQKVPTSWFPYYADSLPSSTSQTQATTFAATPSMSRTVSAQQTVKKSSSLQESLSTTKLFTIGQPIESMVEEFVKQFEKANFKKIEKGQNGNFDNSFDQFLPGLDHLKAALIQLLMEVYGVDSNTASVSLPKQVDYYAVTKITRKFDLREMPYQIIITLGKKAEFAFDGVSKSVSGGSAIMPLSITSIVGQLGFVKVPKTASSTGMSMIGETTILAFH